MRVRKSNILLYSYLTHEIDRSPPILVPVSPFRDLTEPSASS